MNLKKHKVIKRVGVTLGIFLMILLAGIWYLEPIATRYLNDNAESLLNKNPENPFNYEIGEIKLNVWKGGFHVASLKVSPKDSVTELFENGSLKNLIEVKSKGIFLRGLTVSKPSAGTLWSPFAKIFSTE